MKTVLFIPGFKEDIKSRDYPAVIAAIKNSGYKVEFVQVNWVRTVIDDWVKELDDIYAKHDPKNTILTGFSYGAMTAFMSATKRNPAELWLFSLSPYFAEDIKSKDMKPTWLKQIGHRRVTAFSKLNFKKLANTIQCKTLLITGEAEMKKWPVLAHRTGMAYKLQSNSTLVTVPETGHDVGNERYIQAIEKALE